MSIQEILAGSAGIVGVLMTILQVSPIEINPWSFIGEIVGKVLNGAVMEKLEKIEKDQAEKLEKIERNQSKTRKVLDDHIRMDDERNADLHRVQILRFNRELLQDSTPHTQEDFIEALSEIDFYERYCREHKEYENNRAVLAIQNIKQVYKDKLKNHDFS